MPLLIKLAYYLAGGSSDALLPLRAFTAPGGPLSFIGSERDTKDGQDQCPLGYVNTLGTTCVSPIYYEVAPTNGEACLEGWMNIGAGYSKKKKKGVLGIF